MAKKKSKRQIISSVLDANDELRSKYGDLPIESQLRDKWDIDEQRRDASPVEFIPEEEPDENDREPQEFSVGSAAERLIGVATGLLTMLLLGGSMVFWWVVLKYLLVSPYSLADPAMMEAMLISCIVIPVIIASAQTALRSPVNAERWLVCICISGALTAGFVVFVQTVLRSAEMSFADVPVLLCCAVSGCALPSMIFYALRLAVGRLAGSVCAARAADWADVRRDVLELTDFAICRQ